MTLQGREVLRKLALRKWNDPTVPLEMRQMARGLLLLLDGKLPK